MDLFPAIDLRGGRCVRLRQGDFAQETVFDGDPVQVARGYEAAGARWIHVVDLDAARVQGSNREIVVAIADAVGVKVQTGGGVRDASLLDDGLSRIVLGSAAVADPSLVRTLGEAHPGGVAVGLDHWGGEVKVRGWEEGSGKRLLDLVEEMAGPHVGAFVVTDISVDGIGTGPDMAGYADLLRATEVPVLASGGVGTLDHLRALRDLEIDGRRLDGVIVGRALYDGAFTVEEALAALE